MTNSEVKERLQDLSKLDQKHRNKWKSGPEIWKLQMELDKETMAALTKIVNEFGWPTIPMVGEEAAYAAILIAQHSRDIETSVRFLEMAREVYKTDPKNIDGKRLTNWIDAMQLQRQLPQVYGQYLIDKGMGNEIYDIENPERLDERRSLMGLIPFEEHVKNVIAKHPEDTLTILASYERIFGKKLAR